MSIAGTPSPHDVPITTGPRPSLDESVKCDDAITGIQISEALYRTFCS